MSAAIPPIRCGALRMDFSVRPYLMGVLNVTPDSFSDGGRFFERNAAQDHALAMAEAGADIVDVGGESSRPGAENTQAEEEIRRVLPAIEALVRYSTVPVSIDTTKSEVARAALDAGASMVNDISALRFDPRMVELVASAGVPVVLMHMRGTPADMQTGDLHYDDPLGEISAFLSAAVDGAVEAGIDRTRILVDPGIGFGKTAGQNLLLIRRLDAFAALERPVLVGPSRKSFIGKVLGASVDERLFGTAAAVAVAVMAGAHVLRVHDVAAMKQVLRVAQAIRDARVGVEPEEGERG
ncbi:MAG: dihydropteroate synthase [Deltaproteobacteria bacterium]|nr:dihydropteroate synthase [Deltaproteobacteria bacterium]